MPENEQRRTVSARRRRSILVLLFSMLPMLVVAGMLAPGFIQVTAIEDGSDALSVGITRRLSRFGHRPLLIPQNLADSVIPELLDLEHLFSRSDYTKTQATNNRARLPSFPHSYGDVIVLNDTDQRIREIAFKDPVLMAKSAAHTLPPPAKDITPLGGDTPIGSGPRFDDYLGPNFETDEVVVVPEPSTGLLLTLGLLLLTFAGRTRTPRS